LRQSLRAVLTATTCALAACATEPATRFHSLLPAPGAPASAAGPVSVTPLWELLPLKVPAQLENPQWVVRLADDTLALLEYDRWIAPLADEMRAAVALRLVSALGADAPALAPDRPWRIAIEIGRFDAALGRAVQLEAEWTLQAGGGRAPALRCRAAFAQPVGAGMSALAQGQRAAVARLGDAVAASLQGQLGAVPARSCGPPQRG
jgi:uncharacterized lipoprotein YmbA